MARHVSPLVLTGARADLVPPTSLGPISLLVVTQNSPSALRRRVATLLDGNKLLNDTLTLHVLHVDRAAEDTPNAFLNIARLFSPTATVLLFPASLSVAPPSSASALLAGSGLAFRPAPHAPFSDKPALLGSAAPGSPAPAPAYPFAALTPVLVARAHAFWCTERLFLGPSRVSDWDECLWQLWLDALGDVAVLAAPAWRAPPEAPAAAAVASHPITVSEWPSARASRQADGPASVFSRKGGDEAPAERAV